MNDLIDDLINESMKSLDTNDIPIGALVIKDNKIIGRGHNFRLGCPDVTNHAEIIAIRDAEQYLNDWRLSDCDLYVTLEPCNMCYEVIKSSRIKNVYYLLENNEKHMYNKTNKCTIKMNDINVEKYKKILKDFFKNKIRS